MGINYFTFNGESSLNYGVYVGGQGTFNAPQRDVSKIVIPGKNGDLIKDNGRWLNIEVPYNVVIMDDFIEKADDIRNWLCSPTGYARLEDTYNPDYYRMARLAEAIDFETAAFNNAGKTTIIFDCKPQRFLKSGEALVQMTNGGTIVNPTRYESRPLIRIVCSGSGTVTVGNFVITLSEISTYVNIDSETQDCYAGTASLNNKVSLSNGFPVLSGSTSISWTGSVTAVSIAGRWYTL